MANRLDMDAVSGMKEVFLASIEAKKKVIDDGCLDSLSEMGRLLTDTFMAGGKLMVCGNGGSAADAQHLVAEFLVRLRSSHNRQGLPAITLTQDTSTMTACGNDFGFDRLFERNVRTLGNRGDVLLGISTSGNSENVLLAMRTAREMGVTTFGFLGGDGGKIHEYCDKAFIVPETDTGRIQEVHITAGHALIQWVEDQLLSEGYLALQETD